MIRTAANFFISKILFELIKYRGFFRLVYPDGVYREAYENMTINFHLKNLVLLEIKIHNCS